MVMDIVFTPSQWRDQARAQPSQPAPLDWHGLAARLVAADACRRALAGGRAMATGSFDFAMARMIAAQPEAGAAPAAGGESRVNPIASTVGKAGGANKVPMPGRDESGDRGWQ